MKTGMNLDAIGLKYGTDKSSQEHNFLNFYEGFLEKKRGEAISLIEIGVYDGASVKMWSEYFKNGSITGVDINPEVVKHSGERIHIEIGDQSSIECLIKLAMERGPFDVIVDDGSHIWDHQITTLQYLFPFLKSGGIYILEDIDTSYGTFADAYRGRGDISAVDYLKKLCDYMIGDRVLNISAEKDAFIREYARKIEHISFYRRTSVIKKA